MQSGIFERFQSMPIARSSVLWAHVLTSLVANLISLVVVVLVALLMGFRSAAGVLAWLAVAGILVLFTLALTWLAVIAGLSAKTVDGASAFSYPLIFLPFISSAFVPTDTMPGPVRAFAENQPVTSIVNTIRDLFAQQPVGNDIWIALAWCVGILVVAYAFAMAHLPPQDRLTSRAVRHRLTGVAQGMLPSVTTQTLDRVGGPARSGVSSSDRGAESAISSVVSPSSTCRVCQSAELHDRRGVHRSDQVRGAGQAAGARGSLRRRAT